MLEVPHHDPSERWISNPTPDPGEVVTVDLEVPDRSVTEAWLRTVRDGEGEMIEGRATDTPTGTRWRFELPCDNEIVHYRFWLGSTSGARWMTGAGLVDHDPTDHHDFRLSTDGGPPDWVPRTVWYQIFPDRFAASECSGDRELPSWAWRSEWTDPVAVGPDAMTQVYGGDLDGIVDRLDHIVDLGVGGLYLTPIFPARSNHRYDSTTFDRIDPLLGGDDAFVRLRNACDRARLRIVNDITLNHTGDAHDWFTTAQADRSSMEASFYSFGETNDDYASWLGVPSLPKLDHRSTELAGAVHGARRGGRGSP